MTTLLLFRLKGIACADNGDGRNAPARFRSNSVPIPKIEVTLYNDDSANDASFNEGGLDTKDQNCPSTEIPEICIVGEASNKKGSTNLSATGHMVDSPHHIRSSSLRDGLRKKRKSIIQTIEHTKLKNFKSFVESKILSKSNLTLQLDDDGTDKLRTRRKSVSVYTESSEKRHTSVSV